MTMTLDQALALCEHASPMPHLAGQALRVLRDEISRIKVADVSVATMGDERSHFICVCPDCIAKHSSPPAQLWEMKQRACRAHALCNELRLAHPEIPELGDDGVLHEAIHDILRVDTPTAAPAQAAQVDVARFGHHPDPATDFCVEVESLLGEIENRRVGFENGTPSQAKLHARIERALTFRVGGDPHAVRAKQQLRDATTAEPVVQGLLLELEAAAAEVYRISDREHEAWHRLRAALTRVADQRTAR